MIWLCEDRGGFEQIPQEDAAQIIELVPEMHMERILRYRRDCDRLRSALCWGLLRIGLRREYGMELPEVVRLQNGKLVFTEDSGLHFNFSHCQDGVCCVIGQRNLGVDLQDIRTVTDSVIRKCCNDREQALLSGSTDRNRLFAQLWSRKEAMGKATGTGITGNLKHLGWIGDHAETDCFYGSSRMVGERMALAVCSEERMVDLDGELRMFASYKEVLSYLDSLHLTSRKQSLSNSE